MIILLSKSGISRRRLLLEPAAGDFHSRYSLRSLYWDIPA